MRKGERGGDGWRGVRRGDDGLLLHSSEGSGRVREGLRAGAVVAGLGAMHTRRGAEGGKGGGGGGRAVFEGLSAGRRRR
jgi:hypothetical protein